MRLEQFTYILEVAQSKSISIAAKNLFISQPALSRAIKTLESELGGQLLSRTVEGVTLTPAGEVLLPIMQEILIKHDLLSSQAHNLFSIASMQPETGHLHLLTIPSIADSILPIAIETFNTLFPCVDVCVSLPTLSAPFHLELINKDDLFISMDINQQTNSTDLHIEPLFNTYFFAVVHHTHPLAMKKNISIEEALAYKLIVHQNNFQADTFYNLFATLNHPLNIALKSNNSRAIYTTLTHSQCVLITNNFFIRSDYKKYPDLKFIPIKHNHAQLIAAYKLNHPHLVWINHFNDCLKLARTKL